MPWQVRHAGSPRVVRDLTLQQIADGLRDGLWEPTDEALAPGETRWRAIEAYPQLAGIAEELEAPPHRHAEATSLDMNALIDVCLVLLIFFILTTTYANLVQKVVPIPASKSESKARVATPGEIKERMVRLQAVADAGGKPVIRVENQAVEVAGPDGKGIDVNKLEAVLRSYTRGEGRKKEMLLDARGVSWETVIQIQDAARAAGILTIHYAVPK